MQREVVGDGHGCSRQNREGGVQEVRRCGSSPDAREDPAGSVAALRRLHWLRRGHLHGVFLVHARSVRDAACHCAASVSVVCGAFVWLWAGTLDTEESAVRGIRVVLEHQQVHDDATAYAAGMQWVRLVSAARAVGELLAPLDDIAGDLSKAPDGAQRLSVRQSECCAIMLSIHGCRCRCTLDVRL
jgi:hypothetical protein